MNTKRRIATALTFVALAAFVSLGIFKGTWGAHAQDVAPPVGDRISFGMVGVTQGQTARISVANVIAQNDSNFPPGPVRVAIVVINSDGNPFRNRDGSPVRRVAMLERGQATSLDFNADDFPVGGGRILLRAVVMVLPSGPTDSAFPPGPIVPTVEVLTNATGRTVFALSGPPSIRQQPPSQPE